MDFTIERGGAMSRRDFMAGAGAAGLFCAAGCAGCGCASGDYSVAILGDTHYDAEPESVYHSHYDESNRWAKVQHAEFRRNGEMWRSRCPRMVAASAALAKAMPTRFVLQIGDLVQGDCDDAPTHRKMLADCIGLFRAPYPEGLPFLTVVGNHDFRGKGANEAYFEFAEPFMTQELARLGAADIASGAGRGVVKYPAFSFRLGDDLWVFCHFEHRDLNPIADLIEADPAARRVFLVTHGPFTAYPFSSGSFRWRLGGRKESGESRVRLYETLSRRRAIVLSGHTHTTDFYRHENRFGGFTEATVNSVWHRDDLATAAPKAEGLAAYRPDPARFDAEKLAEYDGELGFFRPGLAEYWHNDAAGHYRLNVTAGRVDIEFYPGDAREPARVWRLG